MKTINAQYKWYCYIITPQSREEKTTFILHDFDQQILFIN